MKAILVKYIGPSDTKGGRLKATDCDGNSITVPYDHSASRDALYLDAALALTKKMGWKGRLVQGSLGKLGEVFVFAD